MPAGDRIRTHAPLPVHHCIYDPPQVRGLGRADIVIGPWGDRALDSIILFKEGTAVLELHPTSTHADDLKAAKSEAECLHLSYEQVSVHLRAAPRVIVA